ncbi:hypothetical protein F4859DRAFT_520506 [Xylaria cf. heliscus]|nr:hypothetical protein F4859DRAFT_520506 [Xylaria cf. heliscus]
MPSTELECKVIYFEDEEPMDAENQYPIDGLASCLKILVPHAHIRKYTTEETTADGKTVKVLENPLSHVLYSIYMLHTDPAPGGWLPMARQRAEWDGLPAKDGYYTFHGLNPILPLWSGVHYYHNLQFFDADADDYIEDHLYISDVFQI